MSKHSETNKDGTVYKCPFCLYYDGDQKAVRRHITSTNDNLHKGRNGYELDRSLEETHPDVEYSPDNGNSMKETRDAILDIGGTIEPLEKEDIDSLAEELEISKALLFRTLEDEDIEYNWGYGKPQYYAEDLSDDSLRTLYVSIKEGTDDPEIVCDKVEEYFPGIPDAGEVDNYYFYPSTVRPLLEKKAWMATRRYKDEIVEEVEGRGLHQGKTDEMLETAREHGIVGGGKEDTEKEETEEVEEKDTDNDELTEEEKEEVEEELDEPHAQIDELDALAEQAVELMEEKEEEELKGPTDEGKGAAILTCDQEQLYDIIWSLNATGKRELAKRLFEESIGENIIGAEVIDWDEA